MHQDDEIDLFELFSDLWVGKWAIISFTLITMIFGGSYVVYKERYRDFSHQSFIAFTGKYLPPFYDTQDTQEVFSDFRALFHSAPQFEAWKAGKLNAPINLSDITLTQVVNGVELASNSSLVSLDANGLKVNTNDLQVLNGFHSYMSSVNETLTRRYIVLAEEEINYIERRFKEYRNADAALEDQMLRLMQNTNEVRELERYVERAEGGAHVFEISRPTPPVSKTSPSLIVALSIVLGGFVGAAYVLLRNAIRRRRETIGAS